MSASWCDCETVDRFAIKGGCRRRYIQARRIGSFFEFTVRCAVPSFALDLGPFIEILSYRAVSDIPVGEPSRGYPRTQLTILTM
jgi:hypothetical protein